MALSAHIFCLFVPLSAAGFFFTCLATWSYVLILSFIESNSKIDQKLLMISKLTIIWLIVFDFKSKFGSFNMGYQVFFFFVGFYTCWHSF